MKLEYGNIPFKNPSCHKLDAREEEPREKDGLSESAVMLLHYMLSTTNYGLIDWSSKNTYMHTKLFDPPLPSCVRR